MKQTIRKTAWRDLEGNDLWRAYELSADESNLYFAMLTAIQGQCSSEVKLPLAEKDGLVAAFDNGSIEDWMETHAEMLYRAKETYCEVVR